MHSAGDYVTKTWHLWRVLVDNDVWLVKEITFSDM